MLPSARLLRAASASRGLRSRSLSLSAPAAKSGRGYTDMQNQETWQRRWENQELNTKVWGVLATVALAGAALDVTDEDGWLGESWRLFKHNYLTRPKAASLDHQLPGDSEDQIETPSSVCEDGELSEAELSWLRSAQSLLGGVLPTASLKAASADGPTEIAEKASGPITQQTEEEGSEESKPAKKKSGFKTRRIAEYENRIRAYSTPDKVFRYFATLKVPHSTDQHSAGSTTYEILMTPEDFVRSMSPGILQPEGLGLDRFRLFDPSRQRVKQNLPEDSVFWEIGSSGLISFTDYVFLLTVLSTSPRNFALAFKMFDLNGDGELDYEEFAQVGALIRSQTSVGARHRNHSNTGSTLKRNHPASGLATYFFGQDLDRKLTIQRFLEFQARLQRDILGVEFERRGPDEERRVSEVAFAEMLLQHSGLHEKRQAKMKKRVRAEFKAGGERSLRLSFDEVDAFFKLLANMGDVEQALSFYHMAGASVDPPTLRHVARTVAGVELSAHLIDVVFVLFDENQDGELSNKEFVSVMKRRLMRGLERPKDTGIVRLLGAIYRCSGFSGPQPAAHF